MPALAARDLQQAAALHEQLIALAEAPRQQGVAAGGESALPPNTVAVGEIAGSIHKALSRCMPLLLQASSFVKQVPPNERC